MAETQNTTKAPGQYLADLKAMRSKMGGIVKGDAGKGILVGSSMGVVIGVGYAILYKKSLFRGAMFGAILGSALSFTYINLRTK